MIYYSRIPSDLSYILFKFFFFVLFEDTLKQGDIQSNIIYYVYINNIVVSIMQKTFYYFTMLQKTLIILENKFVPDLLKILKFP